MTPADARREIREELERCDPDRLDILIKLLVVVYQVKADTVEAILHEEVARLSGEHRRHWLGPAIEEAKTV